MIEKKSVDRAFSSIFEEQILEPGAVKPEYACAALVDAREEHDLAVVGKEF
jgi:hypothetical protein